MRVFAAVLVISSAMSSPAWAQASARPSTQAPMPLSLAQAVEFALAPDGSARVALAEQIIQRTELQVEQAKAAFLPTVDSTSLIRNQTVNLRAFGFNFDFPGVVFPTVAGPFTVADLRAQAKIQLLDFTSIRRYRAAKQGLQASRADIEVTRTDVSNQVARAYLAALRAQAAVDAAKANLELSDALAKLAQSQKDAGTGTGIEVTRAQVQVANDRGRLSVAENDHRRAELQLLRTMGVNLSMPVNLTGALGFQAVNVSVVEASLQQARNARVDLQAQKQHEETARLNVNTVDAERLPSVGAIADYGGIGQPRLGLVQTHTAAVSVTIPIFDGGRRKARLEDSVIQLRAEQIRTRDLEDQIEYEIRAAIDSLHSAESQVETARDGLGLAQNEVEQAQRRYQAGVAIPLEITDAQARLDRARNNQINALYNYNLARLDLAAATGTLQEFIQQ